MPSLRDALEAALVENPDDLATHHAYADYLQEQGDPRGEFIQLQLALEDPNRSAREQRRLVARVKELLAEHQREWLGILADELLGSEEEPWDARPESERPYEIGFARGWLDRIVWHESRMQENLLQQNSTLAELLCRAPETRLLRELILEYDCNISAVLRASSFLTNLRVFQIVGSGLLIFGSDEETSITSSSFVEFLARQPRLKEIYLLNPYGIYELPQLFALPNLNNLRVLQVCGYNDPYPLEVLAGNPALKNLTHLQLQCVQSGDLLIDLAGARAIVHSPHLPKLTHLQMHRANLGDVGCTDIVTSGILKRLKVLDLRHGEITDSGARTLADCPDLRNLELLDIERNGLTQTGIDALRRVLGGALRADNQQTAEEL